MSYHTILYDAKVFPNSRANRNLKNSHLPKSHACSLPDITPVQNYIVTNPACHLTLFCRKELDTSSSKAKVIFKNLLRIARNPVECAFRRVETR